MADVSFIVAARNVAPYVEAAVTSALEQTAVSVEVIVVDDASSDATADKVAALAAKDPRVILLRNTNHCGPSAARNAAMDRARGSWLAILDADDLVTPERSRRLLDLAAATSADVVADNFLRFTDQNPRLSTMMNSRAEPYAFFVDIAAFLEGNAMFDKNARLGYIKAMFRTEFLRANAIRHDEDIFIGEDYHLLLSCLLADARFVATSESYYRYRVREGSISWRLTTLDIDRLLKGHANTGLDERFRDRDDIRAASRTYVRALERAKVITGIINETKTGNWSSALASTACHPETWTLLSRFGGAAIEKRLRRLL